MSWCGFLTQINDQATRKHLTQLPRELDQLFDITMSHIEDAPWELAERFCSWLFWRSDHCPSKNWSLNYQLREQFQNKHQSLQETISCLSACSLSMWWIMAKLLFIDISLREYLKR